MPEENHRSRRAWWALVWQRRWWIALATLFILVWWLVPPLLYRHTGTANDAKLKAITDTRTALLAGLIGVGALLTFWLNSRIYRVTTQTFELTEQGHITERYTKAIEQLGDDQLTIRLGGIYALERTAKDSSRDQPTVVEVLSAFVREKSSQGSPPATDIQAAVTTLGRLRRLTGVSRGDLTGAHLQWADLQRADLLGAKLQGADLERADLQGANLRKAGLWQADLQGAELQEADLQGARVDSRTMWPVGFDWQAAGIAMKPDEPTG